MNRNETIFCTVISRSYLRYAAALHAGIRRFDPNATLFALVVDLHSKDSIEEAKDVEFTILPIDNLSIEGIDDMTIYYDAYELISALKPSLMVHLFRNYAVEKLIYLDADIFVVGDFSVALELLESFDLLFTPHITTPLPQDGKLPDDLEIADSGVYNGGFWAVRRTPALLSILDWLIERLRSQCFFWTERRMFCDQKFLPLVAHFCGDRFHCLRDPGYNIAYWNLHERHIELKMDTFLSNGVPATFFHLSGYSETTPQVFTKHADRYTPQTHPVLSDILCRYKSLFDGVPFPAFKGYGYQTHQGIILNTALRRYYFQNRSFDALRPQSEDTLFQSGLAHYKAGRLKEAASEWRRLFERNPQHLAALANLSVCLVRVQDWAGSIKANHKVIALDPTNEQALYNLGHALRITGHPDKARDSWRRLLALNPHHAQARTSLAELGN